MRLLVCLSVLATPLGCSPAEPGPVEPAGRVLIVGIDGASLEVIAPMMDEGRLPHLKQIAEAGASGPLRSLVRLVSPRIWTSVATGRRPRDHGVENWVTGSGEAKRLCNSHDRRVHALWNILSDAGLTVATVNWLMTYPTEPVRGIVVSDLAWPGAIDDRSWLNLGEPQGASPGAEPPEAVGQTTHPAEWQATVEEIARGAGERMTDVPDPFLDNARIPKKSRILSTAAYAKDEQLARLALLIEERARPDVLMILLQGIDRASHWLWGGFEPPEFYPEAYRFTPEEREGSAAALRAYYEFTDQLIGLLLERYDERDMVLVLSDHGFEGRYGLFGRMSGGHNSERARDGVLFARAPGIPAKAIIPSQAVHVFDVAPTILAWLGLPVADDMEGDPAYFLTPERPVRRIATYETKPVPRHALRPSGVEDEVIEELRGLGYVK